MERKEKKVWHGPTGQVCDSYEEVEFWTWIIEAKRIGLIDKYLYHPKPFLLAPAKSVAVNGKEKFLLHSIEYTCDFVIRATPLFRKIDCGGMYSANGADFWIDVKGKFSMFNDDAKFSVIRKWMYDKYLLYINKVIPLDFFQETFCPDRLRFKKNGEIRSAYLTCKSGEELNNELHAQPELF